MKKILVLLGVVLLPTFAIAEGWGDWQTTPLAFKTGEVTTHSGVGATKYRVSTKGDTMEIDMKTLLQNHEYNKAWRFTKLTGGYATGRYDITLDLLTLAIAEVSGYAVLNSHTLLGRAVTAYEDQYTNSLLATAKNGKKEADVDSNEFKTFANDVVAAFKAKFEKVSTVNLVFAEEPKTFLVKDTTVAIEISEWSKAFSSKNIELVDDGIHFLSSNEANNDDDDIEEVDVATTTDATDNDDVREFADAAATSTAVADQSPQQKFVDADDDDETMEMGDLFD